MMTGTQWPFLWTLLIHTGFVFSEIQFLEKREGESVVLPCVAEPTEKPPYGFYLKRSCLNCTKVLFKYTNRAFSVLNDAHRNRISVSGDPSVRSVDVTISQLRSSDTDRYYCEFVVDNPSSEDTGIRGKHDFFLLVHADASGPADIELLQICAGGSAVLPCLPPPGEHSAVESVSLKRQRPREPVELLYNSNHHHSRSSAVNSQFPVEKVRLSLAPGPGGFTYNVTLQQLQPDDSGLYSCQLHRDSRSDSTGALGRRVFFVSVQGKLCCSSYSTLLYALVSAVSVLLLLLLIMLLVFCKSQGKTRHSDKSRPQAPIYEEMTGVLPPRGKRAPNPVDESETSERKNCHEKKSCPENYYEKPTAALHPPALV